MIQPARCPAEFNREGNTGGDTGSQAKEETEAQAVADAEDNGVCDRAGKEAQRTVLSTQQVVGQIKSAQHIKKGTCDTDERDGMVVHARIVNLKLGRSCAAAKIEFERTGELLEAASLV
jgi:hypothetical protein